MAEPNSQINKTRKDTSFLYVDKIDEKSVKASHQQFFNLILPNYKQIHQNLRGQNNEGTTTPENFFAKLLGIDEFDSRLAEVVGDRFKKTPILDYHCSRKTICDWFKKEENSRFIFTPQILASLIGHLIAYVHNISYREIFKEKLSLNHDPILIQEDVKPIFENILKYVQVDRTRLNDLTENSSIAEEERKLFNQYIRTLCDGFGARVEIKTALQVNKDWLFFQKDPEPEFVDTSLEADEAGIETEKQAPKENPFVNQNNKSELYKPDILSDFYSRLEKDFSTINLSLPHFSYSIPIDQMIEFSLSEENQVKKQYLEDLKSQLVTFPDGDEKSKLKTKIKFLEQELSRKYEVIPLLEEGKNIFIHAPAGTGKSTLLRWIVYACSHNLIHSRKQILPIFVELKYYQKDGELELLINEFLSSYHAPKEELSNYQYILLIDGYDEFKVDENVLFKELALWKAGKTVQTVFGGRNIPKIADRNIEYTVFNLNTIGIESLRSFFINRLGQEKGSYWVDLIEGRGVEHHLSNPLFITFILVLIKDQNGKESLQQTIEEYILNEGKLLKTLLVDQFLDYEKHRELRSGTDSDWLDEKKLMIKSLQRMAFKMTFKMGNVEVSRGLANLKPSHVKEEQSSNLVLTKLCNHGYLEKVISQRNNEILISFQKKEFRLFFASLELVEMVKNRMQFEYLLSRLSKDKRNETTISSIISFSLGLIEPQIILKKNRFSNIKNQFFVSYKSADDLKYIFHFLSQKNTLPNDFEKNPNFYIAILKEWLIGLIEFNTRYVFSQRRKKVRYHMRRHFQLRFFASKDSLIQEDIRLANGAYFTAGGSINEQVIALFVLFTQYFGKSEFYSLFKFLRGAQVPSLEDIIVTDANSIKHFKFWLSKELISRAFGSESITKLGVNDKIEFCYSLAMQNTEFSIIYSRTEINRNEISDLFKQHSERFIKYFLDNVNESSFFPYYRLFLFYRKRGFKLLRINANKFATEELDKIASIISKGCLCSFQSNLNNFWRMHEILNARIDGDIVRRVKLQLHEITERSPKVRDKIMAIKSLLALDEKRYLENLKDFIHPNTAGEILPFCFRNIVQLRHPIFQPEYNDFDELINYFLPIMENDNFSIEIKGSLLSMLARYEAICTLPFEQSVISYWNRVPHKGGDFELAYIEFFRSCNNLTKSVEVLEGFLNSFYNHHFAYEALSYLNTSRTFGELDMNRYRKEVEPYYIECKSYLANLNEHSSKKKSEFSEFEEIRILYAISNLGDAQLLSDLKAIDPKSLYEKSKPFLSNAIDKIEKRLKREEQYSKG